MKLALNSPWFYRTLVPIGSWIFDGLGSSRVLYLEGLDSSSPQVPWVLKGPEVS